MRPMYLDFDPANVDPDGICENQTTAGAADLVLNGALCDLGTAARFDIADAGYSSDCAGVRIAIDSAGDINTVVFTVTGKDADGKATTETITGVTTTAIEGTTYWSQITSIAADAEVTSNVFVGPVDEVVSKTIPLDIYLPYPPTIQTIVTGTINYDIEVTNNDITTNTGQASFTWVNEGNFTGKTTAVYDDLALPGYRAMRVVINSYTNTAELQVNATFPY